ncbi:MAG: YbaB/EbfC family nucleoid-associated protein [Puniceicoccales bacterium]|jgi:DNA-binding YbaB/EbfC family protein|nr:YbaB/EbfC family nucleoid-associated protein [Puniceicoccales bacterium]
MAGVGKLLKQAQKVQKRIEETQVKLAQTTIEVSHGGGAVKVLVNGHGEFTGLLLDAGFLKEEKETVERTILAALQEAVTKAKVLHQSSMSAATEGFALAGM